MRSALYAPMKVGARTVGVLAIYSDRRHCYTDHDLQLVSALGEDLGATVAFAIIEDRATQIAVLEERDRQARDLHDGVQQVFSSLRIYVREAERALSEDRPGEAAHALRDCTACIEEASAEITDSIAALREHIDTFGDVYEVLRRMRRRMAAAGVRVTSEIEEVPLVPEVSDALSWICREATTNVLKHSDATDVELRLQRLGDEVVLSVSDNGVGLSVGPDATGRLRLGLQVMRERAERVDGALELSSEPGAGVCVSCRAPVYAAPVAV
jgi:two-component system nitrate/nitrite sensor histidine kinase NarX